MTNTENSVDNREGTISYSAFGREATVNNYQYVNSTEDSFFDLKIEEFQGTNNRDFNGLRIEPNPIELIRQEHLLVLGGNLNVDKSELAFYIISELINHQTPNAQEQDQEENEEFSIKQWKRYNEQEYVSFKEELNKVSSPTIFILLDVKPKHLVERLETIYNFVKRSDHYILITTDVNFANWHLSAEAQTTFFPNLVGRIHFSQKVLINQLESEIRETRKNLGLESQQLRDTLGLDSNFISLLLLEDNIKHELLERLNNPDHISRFARLFKEKIKPLQNLEDSNTTNLCFQNDDFWKIVDNASENDQFIKTLFHEILDEKEKLIAIGLSFFDGLYEDQVFAGLEIIISKAWEGHNPSLRSLDYGDLQTLKDDYFRFAKNDFLLEQKKPAFRVIQTEDYSIDIESIKLISAKDRINLFEIAWDTHRRQIKAALQVLVQITIDSASRNAHTQWELFGDSSRCEKLREVISKSLSDIALASPRHLQAIQGALIQLAQHHDPNIRTVAAQAIAYWGANNHLIFDKTLQKFYSIVLEKDSDDSADENFGEEEDTEDETTSAGELNLQKLTWKQRLSNLKDRLQPRKTREPSISNITSSLKTPEVSINSNDESRNCIYLGQTIAQAVGLTIQDNSEEDQIPKLIQWLQELSESNLEEVLLQTSYFALYEAVPRYLNLSENEELVELLKKIVDKESKVKKYASNKFNYVIEKNAPYRTISPPYRLSYAIARCLARAYDENQAHRNVVRDNIIKKWYDEAVQIRANSKDKREKANADYVLRCVAFTYGLIQYPKDSDDAQEYTISIEDVLDFLHNQLSKVDNSSFRSALLFTLRSLIYRHFDQFYDGAFNAEEADAELEKKLRGILVELKPNEKQEMIKSFEALYQEQRATSKSEVQSSREHPENGSQFIGIAGRYYERYQNPESRPIIPVERMMNDWAKSDLQSLQEIALQTLLLFTKFESSIQPLKKSAISLSRKIQESK